jgi:Phage integrase family
MADRDQANGAWVETGLVFTTRHGTPVEPSNFDRSFDRRITLADVPKITRHSTRKTCGSLLAALDVHPRVAMQILRHSKIAITMRSTPRFRLPPPVRRSGSSGSGLMILRTPDRRLLHFAAAPRSTSAGFMITTGH